MHHVTHLLMGWAVANVPHLGRRDRAVVTLASFVPDLDATGLVAELATRNSPTPLLWWSDYHHLLGHNLAFGLIICLASFAVARRRVMTAVLSLAVFHLHLLCDLVGSRGPDGHDWPLPYLFPFVKDLEISWSGQWALNAWPNLGLTVSLLILTFYLAWRRGFSPLGIVSQRADQAFVGALRNRFGSPGSSSGRPCEG
jgi:inner membrane protein